MPTKQEKCIYFRHVPTARIVNLRVTTLDPVAHKLVSLIPCTLTRDTGIQHYLLTCREETFTLQKRLYKLCKEVKSSDPHCVRTVVSSLLLVLPMVLTNLDKSGLFDGVHESKYVSASYVVFKIMLLSNNSFLNY